MITREQIDLFLKCEGDIDYWARSCSENDRKILDDNSFQKIESFLQNIIRMRNKVLSSNLIIRLQAELKENNFDSETIDIFYKKFNQIK
jgi:hypothetical protein